MRADIASALASPSHKMRKPMSDTPKRHELLEHYLSKVIANIGEPLGCGIAPHPETVSNMANGCAKIIEAELVAMTDTRALLSSPPIAKLIERERELLVKASTDALEHLEMFARESGDPGTGALCAIHNLKAAIRARSPKQEGGAGSKDLDARALLRLDADGNFANWIRACDEVLRHGTENERLRQATDTLQQSMPTTGFRELVDRVSPAAQEKG